MMSVQNLSLHDWDKLRVFLEVAKSGSVYRAGENLQLHQSVVSRRIRSLEADLSTQLFHRHARGTILTEQGTILLDAVEIMDKQLTKATNQIRDFRELARGELRVTTTTGFGTLWISPRLPKLFKSYPDLNLTLILDDEILDLPMREADIAIRMKEPSEADLVRKKIMSTSLGLYMTQEYAGTEGIPEKIEDLREHRLISQRNSTLDAPKAKAFISRIMNLKVNHQMIINNYYGVLLGVKNNLGIGLLPGYVAEMVPDLIQILPDLESDPIPLYLAYSYELKESKKLKVFRDFILSEVKGMNLAKSKK